MSLGEELRDAALAAAREGCPVFPCSFWKKTPAFKGWQSAATMLERQILAWWDGVTMYNPAMLTGYRYDLLDVDVRATGNGWTAFNALKEAGMLAGAQRLVRTRSGGLHVYFAGSEQRSHSLPGLHIEFKGRGGWAMLPPSVVGGLRYEVIDDRPRTGRVFDWEAAKRLLVPPRPYRPSRAWRGSQRHLVKWLEGQFDGNRNDGLFWTACRAFEAGDEDTAADLGAVALSAGLSDNEVRSTLESARRETSNGR